MVALFPADESIAAVGFNARRAQKLGERLGFADISVQGTGRLLWVGRKGNVKLGDRELEIESAQGNEHELSVGVVGETADAIDALEEIWSVLSEMSGKSPGLGISKHYPISYATTATVVAPKPLFEILPFMGKMKQKAVAAVRDDGGTLVEPPNGPTFRVQVNLQIAIGGVHVARALTIEPRFTATEKDRVLHTESPLTSPRHFALLEELLCSEA